MAQMKKEIALNDEQKKVLHSNLDENGKLSCIRTFKVARLMKVEAIDMADACRSEGIKINNCELGVFGKLEFHEPEDAIYEKIAQNFDGNTDVECKTLWDLAKEFSLKRVGSTAKFSDAEVTFCKLGCFNLRKGHREVKN